MFCKVSIILSYRFYDLVCTSYAYDYAVASQKRTITIILIVNKKDCWGLTVNIFALLGNT